MSDMELKPCPFCGFNVEDDREAALCDPIINENYKEGDNGYYEHPSQVVCPSCGACAVGAWTIESAIKAWNTRGGE